MEQQQSIMTMRVASRLKKKYPTFSSCENETYWNTIIISQERKKKSVNEKLDLTHVLSQE
jgi:hypothetical protein